MDIPEAENLFSATHVASHNNSLPVKSSSVPTVAHDLRSDGRNRAPNCTASATSESRQKEHIDWDILIGQAFHINCNGMTNRLGPVPVSSAS